ncbi:MAG: hypothetical protein IPO30_20060 [Hyphomonadaceae bacterium]|nr:hypothetical protein [Hyphomonadaceae bacterium]
MALLRTLAVAALCLSAVPCTAQQTQAGPTLQGYLANPYAMMRDFGRCAALQEHLATVLVAAGKPANAEEMRGYARGSDLAASVGTIAHEPEKMTDSASEAALRESQARIVANQRSLESIKELEHVRQRAFAERGEIDIEQMNFCASLNQIQKTIVESMRESGFLSQ